MSEGLSEQELRQAFNAFDKKKKGWIKIDLLPRALGKVGLNPTDKQMEKITQKIDPNGTKKVSYDTFVGLTKQQNKGYTTVKGIVQAFQVFDREGDGIIEIDELKHVLLNLGEKLPPQDVDELVAEADPEGTGNIYYEDFAKMLLD